MSIFFLLFVLGISGCKMVEQLATIDETPRLTQIKNPTTVAGYQPVDMPMPEPMEHHDTSNHGSLWPTGAGSFFKDRRANRIGDIITVLVDIDQEENMSMSPNITRKAQGSTVVDNVLGLEREVEKVFPKNQRTLAQRAADVANPTWFKFSSEPSLSGSSSYDVKDKMKFKIAAHVIQKLPNGNMVIKGRSEVRLVNEVREVSVTGIVRRSDITSSNTVTSDKIAELRISYGGRGDLSSMQEFPLGHKIVNVINPF